jgi:cysteine desulfurase
MPAIYLDANASTPLDPAVLDAMLPYLRDHFGNATSGHARGQVLNAAMETARGHVADLLGCEPDEIYFTSGGSESNNLIVKGVASAARGGQGRHMVISAVEHPSVLNAALALEADGWRITQLGVRPDGRVDPAEATAAVTPETRLVSVILAQNETGTLQPLRAIAEAIATQGPPLLHSDAAQAIGKIPVKVRDLGVDLLSLAAHKFYGPWGIGAVYARRGTPLAPLIHGAGHERGMRSGTPNVAAIAGLGEAARLANARVAAECAKLAALRDRLWQQLAHAGGVARHGHPAECLPNTLNVGFEGVFGADIVAAAADVQCSTGSACHSGSRELSGVLAAMGVSPVTGLGALRLSLCRTTTESEVDEAATILLRAVRSLREEARPKAAGGMTA